MAESALPDLRALFEPSPGLFVVVKADAPQFTVVDVSDAYLAAMTAAREDVVGRGVFQVIPGDAELGASLERVLRERVPDAMAARPRDVRPSRGGGAAGERWWLPVNTPVLGPGGDVAFVVHRLEEVTPEGAPSDRGTSAAAGGAGAEPPPRASQATTAGAGRAGALVLVVEDDPDMVRFLVRGLSDRYRVETASDGAEGLSRALELRPDLILTDVLMPRMSGDELVTAARLRPELAKTPIVLMTAKVDDELRVRALQEGAHDYLAKPFLLSELRARIENLLARKRDEDVLAARVAERTAEVEALASRLRALSVELMQSEQRERRRLASVLHDGLQPILVGAKLHLSLLRREALSEAGMGAADHVGELLDEAVGIARSLTVALSPPILREAGLAAALEWLVGRMEQQHRFTVAAALDPEAVPPGWRLSEMLFEAARELLFNAVKYSGTDRAQLVLAREGDRVRLVVSDEGAGFDPAQVPVGKATAGQFGLFAVQQRLAWLGGTMEIDSAFGRGARVELRVPLAAGAVPDEPQPRPSAKDRSRDAIRVLVVDDHPIVREGLVQLLELEPDIVVVGEAENGVAALSLVAELNPDIVLMDVSMPVMDGVEATRILSRKAPGTPIVALSAHDEGSPAAPMRLAGAVAHVAKGGPTEELLQAIRTFGRKGARPAG